MSDRAFGRTGFVDECAICVSGGAGGSGCVSFRREAHVDRGGPDGGDGGRGGDVWLVADEGVVSLLAFKDHPHRRAGNGVHGSGSGRRGRNGKDKEVPVPVGTTVLTPEGERLADLSAAGQRFLAAAGGAGGRGNARFLNNRRRAPRFAEQGEQVQERWLHLEMKLLADAALVGFPNAGKSTLLSRISASKARVADYPFTTLVPNLGVVATADGEDFVVADVPGLIEGASEGKGLGHRFLRHVERSLVLVVLLDVSPDAEFVPEKQLDVLLGELGAYRPELLDRRRLVIASKVDVSVPLDWVDLNISAVTGRGVGRFIGRLSALVKEAREEEGTFESARESARDAAGAAGAAGAPDAPPVVHRPPPKHAPEMVYLEREGEAWRVRGRPAERAVALSDLTEEGAMAYALDRLRNLGVDRMLSRASARTGDEVRVGEVAFEYVSDALHESPGEGEPEC